MFEHLGVRPKIVVTGPQRSGTRIAARIIAADTGHRFVDECEFLITDGALFLSTLDRDGVVVQAPNMLKDVVDDPPLDIFVVLMRRDLDQIHRSAQRIGWAEDLGGNTTELRKFGLSEGDSAAIKYAYWDQHNKSVPFIELEYESLTGHPLYVPAAFRKNFGPLQTDLEEPLSGTSLSPPRDTRGAKALLGVGAPPDRSARSNGVQDLIGPHAGGDTSRE